MSTLSHLDWNKTTALAWRNTFKREQFRHIMDARQLPNRRNGKFKNVQPQYLKPRKRYDSVPPNPKKKKKKRYKPLAFPLAAPCSCDKNGPKQQRLSAWPPEEFLSGCYPLGVSTDDPPPCCFQFTRSLDDNTGSSPGPAASLMPASPKSKTEAADDKPIGSAKSHGSVTPDRHDAPKATVLPESHKATRNDLASTDTAASSSIRLKLLKQPIPSSAPATLLPEESDSKAGSPSDKAKTAKAGLAIPGASLGHPSPLPAHEELEAKQLATALVIPRLWNCGGVCRMRFPFLARRGEIGEEDDF